MVICALTLSCVQLGACGQQTQTTPVNPPTQKDAAMPKPVELHPAVSENIDALAAIIPLNPRPIAVTWQREVMGTNRVNDIPGPTDYKLTAVLQYRAGDAAVIAANAAKIEAARPGQAEWRDWFPSALKESAAPTPTGALALKGERYQPTYFQRSPLLQGTLVRVANSDFFVLTLITT
jgi:hypothetical protein